MKNLRLMFPIAVIAASFLAFSAHAETGWLTDYKQAQQKAKSENKLLLLDFTGSDWCGWCIKLNREVFSQPKFKDYAAKNLVLMEVDFPRQKAIAPNLREQNSDLAQQYEVRGFPTVVVLNGEGKMVGELGYMEGGVDAFISELEKLHKS